MSERKETSRQVVDRSEYLGKTEVWEKNSAGCTTKEGHRTVHHGSGVVTDHYGKKIAQNR